MNSRIDLDYEYYKDGYIYGKPETNEQTLCLKNKQSEAQALELTYSHLGRLLKSAKMLAYKLNLTKNNYKLKFKDMIYLI